LAQAALGRPPQDVPPSLPLYWRHMKKLLLAVLASAVLSPLSASAETPVMDSAAMMANGTPARAVMDGGREAPGAVPATPGEGQRVVRTGSGANLVVGRPTAGTPPPPEQSEPGFFSKAWDFVKKPSFLAPAGMAVAMGAMGAMIAGPLGAITGALIGALFGFIFVKAMG
jgi:hypothetical protein